LQENAIWIVCQYAGSKYHGMNYRPYYLAREFTKSGYNVCIISGSYSHTFTEIPESKGLFTFEKIDEITYVWVRLLKYTQSKSAGRVLNMLLFTCKLFLLPVKKLPPPKVIIVSSPSPFPVINAHRWGKKFEAKFFFEVRDIWPLTLMELGNYSKYHPFIIFTQWFENFAYKKADYVVSVLPEAVHHMVSHGLKRKKFNHIPNGIYIDEIEEQFTPLADFEKDTLKDRFIVGYAGAVGIANALDSLVDAAEILTEHKEICILVVGNGGEKERLQKKTEHLENVFFLKAVPKAQVRALLEHFDVCYIGLKNVPLFRFGVSPNKLFDYMLAGKPVVYAINSGNDPVQEAECGLSVEAENPSAIADAIVKLYKMGPEERNRIGKNGKVYVVEHHSYTRLAQKYIELFNR
jgi:glycosyltransferase involved in cell wall biosynthesis